TETIHNLIERLSTGILLGFLIWKVWPIFTWWSEILDDPMRLLRLPGGRGGLIAGTVVCLLFVTPRIIGRRSVVRPILIAIGAGALAAVIATSAITAAAGTAQTAAIDPSQLHAPLLTSPEGTPAAIGEPGRPTMLTFWATWCGPCRAELPVKAEFYDQYRDRIRIVSVNMLNTEGGVGAVQRFAHRHEIRYPVHLDERGRIASLLNVRGTPTTVVLDGDGTVVSRWVGASSLDRLRRAAEKAIGPQE
ncbi:MAG: TlpA family protein disulfide reductase, partial [Spirochaetales bacterium]|nr:TlpA family protein disulfide reductase [Spirochaetales bacterium]